MLLAQTSETEVTDVSGEIPHGFLYASVYNIGSVDVQVNGVVLEPGQAKDYPFVGKGQEAIPYLVSDQGLLRIMVTI